MKTLPKRIASISILAESNPAIGDEHFFGLVLYGPSGIGKSSFGAEFENDGGCAFVVDPQEKGIFDLIQYKQCPTPRIIQVVDGWKHLLKTNEKLALNHTIKNVVFDSMTGLQQLCYRYHCKEYFDDDWSKEGFYSFQSGPKNAAQRDWPDLIQSFEVLRESGKNIIVIGHSQIKSFKNPDGEDFDKFSPFLEKEIWAATHRWATAVIFYKSQTDTKKVGGRYKGNEETQKRLLCCTQGATYDAKNRYGLPPVILAGESNAEAYAAFKREFDKCGR